MSFLDNETLVVNNGTIPPTNWLLQTSLWSLRILCPIFIIICPISNWACIRIFQSRIYARSSSKWYFIFIAIFDTIYVLVTGPLLFLITLQVYILNKHVLLCKSIVFLNYLSCQISAGLLACLSIDRLLATSCLSLYRQNCTTNFSRMICLIVIFLFSILNSHYLIGYSIDSQGFCNIKHYKWYETNYSHLKVVYLLSYSIIPFTIITICNFCIVLSVCQNKANMKKKYETQKSPILKSLHAEQILTAKSSIKITENSQDTFQFDQYPINNQSKTEPKHLIFTSVQNDKLLTDLHDSAPDWISDQNNCLSEKFFLSLEGTSTPCENSPKIIDKKRSSSVRFRERSYSSMIFSSSPNNSQKMCIQLQITISLLTVSISFIFCTLPNCISTFMIQTYTNDEHVRQFWQTMNYFSIVPLLATRSANLLFYYLSSKMFRERFEEYYLKKKT